MPVAELSIAQLAEDVHAALRLWRKDDAPENPLTYLRLYQVLAQSGCGAREATEQLLRRGLERLQGEQAEAAELLYQRFEKGDLAFEVANHFSIGEAAFYKRQRQALWALARILYTMEQELQGDRGALLDERLGTPPWQPLVGLEQSLAYLSAPLLSPAAPWIVSLEGIGGIGKTTLAQALIRQLVLQGAFYDFAWVSARQLDFPFPSRVEPKENPTFSREMLVEALVEQVWEPGMANFTSSGERFRALQSRLRAYPYLIGVDNLETRADLESVLPVLRDLAGPTKFLLTSRESGQGDWGLFCFMVRELSEPDALELVREQARMANLMLLAEADRHLLQPIYATVGGNPLALRLVVGQTRFHALDVVLADLYHARGSQIKQLYTHIYRRAWATLDPTARGLFLSMLLAPEEGAELGYLGEVSQLAPDELRDSLDKLLALNVVETRGGVETRRYTLQPLTRTFLHLEVLRWE